MVSEREKRLGVFFVFVAAVLYSIGGLCIKLIPWHGMSINSGRNLVALLVIGGYLALTRHRPRWNRWIAVGTVCVSGCTILYSVANKMTAAANVIVLQFTAPIFVMLFAALIWRRRPDKLDVAACVVVLLGVACFFVESLESGDMLGNFLSLLSGAMYAVVFLLEDFPDCDPISAIFWGSAVSALTGLPFLLRETEFTPTAVTSLIVLGAFQVGVAFILLTIGLKTTPAVTASLVSGIEPVLNPILVVVFYHETIGPLSLLGAVIVVAGVVGYNVLRARNREAVPAEK